MWHFFELNNIQLQKCKVGLDIISIWQVVGRIGFENEDCLVTSD